MLFWRLTPKMVHAIVDACIERNRRDHNNRAWLAWHIAVLPHQRRVPTLQSLMIPDRSKQQTWQEQMRIARAITVACGGQLQ